MLINDDMTIWGVVLVSQELRLMNFINRKRYCSSALFPFQYVILDRKTTFTI